MNQNLLQWLEPESVAVEIVRVEEPEEAGIEESELNEMAFGELSRAVELCRQKEQSQDAS